MSPVMPVVLFQLVASKIQLHLYVVFITYLAY